MQQAMGNAQALVALNLKRDVSIDGSVFGMGRGAGNLNLELFARYMNQNYGTSYRIEPMLEIIDEYLIDIYKKKYWGYSLPLYLSAVNGCHPNYAIYLQDKNTLTEKEFNELLKNIPSDKKSSFSKENAEFFYKQYMDNHIDDKLASSSLKNEIADRNLLILAPGKSLLENKDSILSFVKNKQPLIFAVNFDSSDFPVDYIFSSNMRRFAKIQFNTNKKCIITSNMKEAQKFTYMFNFSSYCSEHPVMIDNAGIMLLKILLSLGIKDVSIAGMDGYGENSANNYFSQNLEFDFSSQVAERNHCIASEINDISKNMKCRFITPSIYQTEQK
jgi:4-hydroxy 2-oxovalerate aldolase